MASTALIIPFPVSAIHRSAELVDALAKLEMCQAQADDNPAGSAKHDVALIMMEWWERELVRMGGLPRHQLQHDVVPRHVI